MPPNSFAAARYIACTDASSATSTCTPRPPTSSATFARRVAVDVGDDDLRALLGEELRSVGAHAAAGAGDHADLVVQPVHSVE